MIIEKVNMSIVLVPLVTLAGQSLSFKAHIGPLVSVDFLDPKIPVGLYDNVKGAAVIGMLFKSLS